jgi:heme oxygenase
MLSSNIKEATKEAHLQLERIVVQKLKAIRSNADYADLLRYFYAYFSSLEKAILPYITTELLPDYKDRRNSSYIKMISRNWGLPPMICLKLLRPKLPMLCRLLPPCM